MPPLLQFARYRDVRDSGITLAEFERRARRLRNRERTTLLARAWRKYEQLIATLPAVDPADVLERAAVLIESGRAVIPAQVVAGFYDMTGAQMRIISALRTAGKLATIIIPIGDDEAYAFGSRFVSQLKSSLIPQPSSLHIKVAKKTVDTYPTKEEELRAICSSIRTLLDSGAKPNQIGIVARSLDPDDVRLLLRFSAEHEFAVS